MRIPKITMFPITVKQESRRGNPPAYALYTKAAGGGYRDWGKALTARRAGRRARRPPGGGAGYAALQMFDAAGQAGHRVQAGGFLGIARL